VNLLVPVVELVADLFGTAIDVSDHQPRTLLMASKTSSGVWSTEKAAVKLAFPAGSAIMSGLRAG
jgi:hypothetical protein